MLNIGCKDRYFSPNFQIFRQLFQPRPPKSSAAEQTNLYNINPNGPKGAETFASLRALRIMI